MKTKLLRVLALVLIACMLLPFAVACGGNTTKTTETETKKIDNSSATESATEKATESETESETELEQPDDAVCYVGTENKAEAYYTTVEEAVADYPDGCNIFMVNDYAMPEDVYLPDDVHFTVTYLFCEVELHFHTGVIAEYSFSGDRLDKIYFSHVEDLYGQVDLEEDVRLLDDLHAVVFWVFEQQGEYAPGRYVIKNVNADDSMLDPEYVTTMTDGIEMWGVPYTMYDRGFFFYSIAECCRNLVPEVIMCAHVIYPLIELDEPVDTTYPGNSKLRIQYDYFTAITTFSWGVTYDDDQNPSGFCYYNDLYNHLSTVASLYDTYIYIWSDVEGFLPGRYLMAYPTGEDDVFDEATDLMTESEVGNYRFVRVCDIPCLDQMDSFREVASVDAAGNIILSEAWNGFAAGVYFVTNVDFGENGNDAENRVYDGEVTIAGNVNLFRLVALVNYGH